MASKKTAKTPASKKRAALPLTSDYTRQFRKDWKALNDSGRYDMARLRETMLLLIANTGPLPAEYLDHDLTGQWTGHRECHVGGDFLLIYLRDDTGIIFTRAGTHAELFE
jgi:mRNA interferase YafQ